MTDLADFKVTTSRHLRELCLIHNVLPNSCSWGPLATDKKSSFIDGIYYFSAFKRSMKRGIIKSTTEEILAITNKRSSKKKGRARLVA